MPSFKYEKVMLEDQFIGELTYDGNEIFATPEKGGFGTFQVKTREDGIALCIHFHNVIVPDYNKILKWTVNEGEGHET